MSIFAVSSQKVQKLRARSLQLVDRSSPKTKIAQNVAKTVPFITSKSELQYSNPLQNASVLNKGHLANFAQNRLPWQRP